MPVDANAQAILLLTVSLGKADGDGTRPLTGLEWHRLASALWDRGTEPAALLSGEPSDLLSDWEDKEITVSRLQGLLERGLALGVALERWERAGLWVVTGSDRDYPARLRERLGGRRPPVLFGCGDRGRLAGGGIAVVGSRDVDSEDLRFAEQLGAASAEEGCVVVSGGAKGTDQRAMAGALERGGGVVGVLANGLLGAASSAGYRDFLMSGDLTLISPFSPDSGFAVSRAMGRNKCIYCLADSAVVVSSTFRKGGTWAGATECLKAGWVPVWVRDREDMSPGSAELLKRGARRLPGHLGSISELAGPLPLAQPRLAGIVDAQDVGEPGLQAEPAGIPESGAPAEPDGRDPLDTDPERRGGEPGGVAFPEPPMDRAAVVIGLRPTGQADGGARSRPDTPNEPGFFDLFLSRFRDITSGDTVLTVGDIAAQMPDLEESQVRKWLKRGESEDVIEKFARPVRYRPKRPGLL